MVWICWRSSVLLALTLFAILGEPAVAETVTCASFFARSRVSQPQSHDVEGWLRMLDESVRAPQSQLLALTSLRPALERVSEAVRARLLADIGLRLSEVADTEERLDFHHYAPKRVLTAWFRVLMPALPFFTEAARRGQPANVALDRYISTVRTAVVTGTHSPASRSRRYVNVTSQDVLDTAIAFADELEATQRLPTDDRYVLMFGSFTTGLARVGSDIDIAGPEYFAMNSVNNPLFFGDQRWNMTGLTERLHFFGERPALARIVKPRYFVASNREFFAILSALSPYVIEIRPDMIVVKILGTPQVQPPRDQPTAPVSGNGRDVVQPPPREKYFSAVVAEYPIWTRPR